MRERAVDEVGEDLLALGVAAVLGFGLGQDERGVGEHGVVAPGREQLALAGLASRLRSLTRRTISRAVTACAFSLGRERGIGHLGYLGVGHPPPGLVIPYRARG